ncbi:hypothetical protein APHAL10511_006192 [Amanita phalloides]|nr:hypothetical protein APHAL10511_006192 [Amanita phalloides]
MFTFQPQDSCISPCNDIIVSSQSRPRSNTPSPSPLLGCSSTTSELKNPTRSRTRNHIPRPRNAFMIFRSEFCAREKISRSVERDHRHISRIIGYYWNKLPESEKDVWRRKAEQEKSEHLRKYPGYRFTPTVRSKRPIKRNVKRNGADDLLRCQLLADFLMLGKEGKELEDAARTLEVSTETRTPEHAEFSAYTCISVTDGISSYSHSPVSDAAEGTFIYGFPAQPSCYPSTVERSFSFEAIPSNHNWDPAEGVESHIRDGGPSRSYRLQTQFSDIFDHRAVREQYTTSPCWQVYHDLAPVDPSAFQFSSY